MVNYSKIIKNIVNFQEDSLTKKLSRLEEESKEQTSEYIKSINKNNSINLSLLDNAFTIKEVTSKLYLIIHAVGILITLPHILWKNEKILYLSLGAGNSGKGYDLETNKRVAEFKFIKWQNKSNTLRQNSIFKDFYCLAEYSTKKKKFLYTLDLEKPINFLKGKRNLESVLSRNSKIKKDFEKKFGNKYKTVSEYYNFRKDIVKIVDLNKKIPSLHKKLFVVAGLDTEVS